MYQSARKKHVQFLGKVYSLLLSVIFASSMLAPSLALAQSVGVDNVSIPVMAKSDTPAFVPVLLKGLTIDQDDPLKFEFILDSGSGDVSDEEIQGESNRLVKYFLSALTIPQDDFWVNLSPYESERIIPEALGQTNLGRELLEQDYILKQITATLIHPESELGEKFWEQMRMKALERYGRDDIKTDTFSKVWILPESATVYEHGQTVFVVDAHLKVMTDADYLAAKTEGLEETKNIQTEIIKEIIVPAIEHEVNVGKNFAPLRQIYHSLILAKWYKETVKRSVLSDLYVDQAKVAGVALEDHAFKQTIYDQYMRAYQKGVFNFIKEDYDAVSQQMIPRKYFSGGIKDQAILTTRTTDGKEIEQSIAGRLFRPVFDLLPRLGLERQSVEDKSQEKARVDQIIQGTDASAFNVNFVISAVKNGYFTEDIISFLRLSSEPSAVSVVDVYNELMLKIEQATGSRQYSDYAVSEFMQAFALRVAGLTFDVRFNENNERFEPWTTKADISSEELDLAAVESLKRSGEINETGRWVYAPLIEIVRGFEVDHAMITDSWKVIEDKFEVLIGQITSLDLGNRHIAIDGFKQVKVYARPEFLQRLRDLRDTLHAESLKPYNDYVRPYYDRENPHPSYQAQWKMPDNGRYLSVKEVVDFYEQTDVDQAVLTDVGGIDFNVIDVTRQGEGVAIQFNQGAFEPLLNIGVEGFAPVFINISPVNNLLLLLGLDAEASDNIVLVR